MKSTFDILTTVFKSVATVMDPVLGGKTYMHGSPDGNQEENIILNVLANPISYVQDGILNVNIEAMELEKGVPNSSRFDALVKLLIPIFDNTTMAKADNTDTIHCSIDADKGLFKDKDSKGKYLYNLRVRFVTL